MMPRVLSLATYFTLEGIEDEYQKQLSAWEEIDELRANMGRVKRVFYDFFNNMY